MNLVLLVILISTGVFSKHNDVLHHNYYKNIQSIKNSFHERKVGFNLSQEQINTIGKRITVYEQNNHTSKKIKFYARADIAFVLKYIYKKHVLWEGRRSNPDYIKIYKNREIKSTNHILFETPKDFPKYIPYR